MVAIRCSEIPDIRASEVPDIPGSKALAGKSIDANPLEISRVPIMTEPLAGKLAVVTGASRGIGRSIAHRLATAGCDIVANYYNSHEEAEKLCDEVRALGRRAFAVKASVGIPESVDELLEELRKHFDRIDIIVSNAASGVLKPAMKMTLKHWRWSMETNALALNLVTQRAVEMMP